MEIIKNLPKTVKVIEVTNNRNVHNAKDVASSSAYSGGNFERNKKTLDENVVKNFSSELSKLNFLTRRPNNLRHLSIAENINEINLTKKPQQKSTTSEQRVAPIHKQIRQTEEQMNPNPAEKDQIMEDVGQPDQRSDQRKPSQPDVLLIDQGSNQDSSMSESITPRLIQEKRDQTIKKKSPENKTKTLNHPNEGSQSKPIQQNALTIDQSSNQDSPMSERSTPHMILPEKSDQTIKKKSPEKKTKTLDQINKALKVQRTKDMPGKQSPRNTKRFGSTSQGVPLSQANDQPEHQLNDQMAGINEMFADQIDRTLFNDPTDHLMFVDQNDPHQQQQWIETRELNGDEPTGDEEQFRMIPVVSSHHGYGHQSLQEQQKIDENYASKNISKFGGTSKSGNSSSGDQSMQSQPSGTGPSSSADGQQKLVKKKVFFARKSDGHKANIVLKKSPTGTWNIIQENAVEKTAMDLPNKEINEAVDKGKKIVIKEKSNKGKQKSAAKGKNVIQITTKNLSKRMESSNSSDDPYPDSSIYESVKKIRDNHKYIVSKILGMLVYGTYKRRMYFVEWQGYPNQECWVQSESMNAQELVANFIVECSINSALSFFSGKKVMKHVADLIEDKPEAKELMKKMRLKKKIKENDASKNIVFSKAISPEQKKKAKSILDKFMTYYEIPKTNDDQERE